MSTPEAKADRLVTALNENTEALRTVKRRYRWTMVLTALLALTLLLVGYSNYEADMDSCRSNNQIRADIDGKFSSIASFLDELVRETPENQEFVELVDQDLGFRDCSSVGWFN